MHAIRMGAWVLWLQGQCLVSNASYESVRQLCYRTTLPAPLRAHNTHSAHNNHNTHAHRCSTSRPKASMACTLMLTQRPCPSVCLVCVCVCPSYKQEPPPPRVGREWKSGFEARLAMANVVVNLAKVSASKMCVCHIGRFRVFIVFVAKIETGTVLGP